jgi:capsular polysaccharide transport system permease protein
LEQTTTKTSIGRRIRARLNTSTIIFFATIVIPTISAVLYYGLIASDMYISESRFVVRTPQRQSQPGIVGALLQGTGFSRSQDDTYSVRDFILSRDALGELDQKLNVIKAYSSTQADFINRFPGFDFDRSFEGFHRYYRKQVSVDYDPTSSITVLNVHAFSASDAKQINDMLLTMSERLVNNLNDRSRGDLIKTAEQEVKLAEDRVKNASGALSAFRNTQTIFDPEKQSAIQLQSITKLQEELIATQAQLTQVQSLTPSNPQVETYRKRVADLQKTIANETAKITGSVASLTSKSGSFDRLTIEKGFAERQLTTALATLEAAKSEAARKQLYLERLVQPNLPDKAQQPRRIRGVITVLLVGLLAWGVATLLAASVKEHVE